MGCRAVPTSACGCSGGLVQGQEGSGRHRERVSDDAKVLRCKTLTQRRAAAVRATKYMFQAVVARIPYAGPHRAETIERHLAAVAAEAVEVCKFSGVRTAIAVVVRPESCPDRVGYAAAGCH